MPITFVSSSDTAFGTSVNTTTTAPAGIVNDDFLVLGTYTGLDPEAPDTTPPAGFTQRGTTVDQTQAGFPLNAEWRVYTKKAASESGNYTVTHASASAQALMMVFRGVDTTTPMDVTETTASGTGQTTTATGLTTVTNGARLVFVERSWDGSVAQIPPFGMSEHVERVVVYGASEEIITAGPTGNRSHLNSNTAALGSELWAVVMMALRPAVPTVVTAFGSLPSRRLIRLKR